MKCHATTEKARNFLCLSRIIFVAILQTYWRSLNISANMSTRKPRAKAKPKAGCVTAGCKRKRNIDSDRDDTQTEGEDDDDEDNEPRADPYAYWATKKKSTKKRKIKANTPHDLPATLASEHQALIQEFIDRECLSSKSWKACDLKFMELCQKKGLPLRKAMWTYRRLRKKHTLPMQANVHEPEIERKEEPSHVQGVLVYPAVVLNPLDALIDQRQRQLEELLAEASAISRRMEEIATKAVPKAQAALRAALSAQADTLHLFKMTAVGPAALVQPQPVTTAIALGFFCPSTSMPSTPSTSVPALPKSSFVAIQGTVNT
jgi:hypothetical protein